MKLNNPTLMTLLLTTALTFSFVACGDDDPKPEPTPTPTPVDTTSTEKPDTTSQEPVVEAAIGWPGNYGGVMLQAFYWAHKGNTATPYTEYGDVTWAALNAAETSTSPFVAVVTSAVAVGLTGATLSMFST